MLNWIRQSILFPFTPLFVELFFRWVFNKMTFDMTVINGSTLCVTSGVYCLLVNMSLLQKLVVAIDDEERDSVRALAYEFMVFAFVGVALFGFFAVCDALRDYGRYDVSGEDRDVFVFASLCFSGLVVLRGCFAFRSYKLRAF